VVVQFDDGGVDAEGDQQLLHDVAHAARGSAEDDDRVLRYQPPDAGLRRLRHVDRQRRGRRRAWWAQVEADDFVGATSQALHRSPEGSLLDFLLGVTERKKRWRLMSTGASGLIVGGGFLGSFINERMLWLLTSQFTVTPYICIILTTTFFPRNQKVVGRDNNGNPTRLRAIIIIIISIK
jgi:hypothetical protein